MCERESYEARVYFLTTEEGGRAGPVPRHLRVPMWIGEEMLDCSIDFVGATSLSPLGREHEVSVSFRFPEYAREAIERGRSFLLWDGRIIARGEIVLSAS